MGIILENSVSKIEIFKKCQKKSIEQKFTFSPQNSPTEVTHSANWIFHGYLYNTKPCWSMNMQDPPTTWESNLVWNSKYDECQSI